MYVYLYIYIFMLHFLRNRLAKEQGGFTPIHFLTRGFFIFF